MADLTAQVKQLTPTGAAPNYVAVAATDYFTAQPNARYILHYKNGATTTGGAQAFKITDPTTPTPVGASPGAGFADVVVSATGMGATSELICQIPNSDRHRDSNGRINLVHGGTLTTVTLAILGPFPA